MAGNTLKTQYVTPVNFTGKHIENYQQRTFVRTEKYEKGDDVEVDLTKSQEDNGLRSGDRVQFMMRHVPTGLVRMGLWIYVKKTPLIEGCLTQCRDTFHKAFTKAKTSEKARLTPIELLKKHIPGGNPYEYFDIVEYTGSKDWEVIDVRPVDWRMPILEAQSFNYAYMVKHLIELGVPYGYKSFDRAKSVRIDTTSRHGYKTLPSVLEMLTKEQRKRVLSEKLRKHI